MKKLSVVNKDATFTCEVFGVPKEQYDHIVRDLYTFMYGKVLSEGSFDDSLVILQYVESFQFTQMNLSLEDPNVTYVLGRASVEAKIAINTAMHASVVFSEEGEFHA